MAIGNLLLRLTRLFERPLAGDRDERHHLGIQSFNLIQASTDQFNWRKLARPDH
jgi:hypothetical protein